MAWYRFISTLIFVFSGSITAIEKDNYHLQTHSLMALLKNTISESYTQPFVLTETVLPYQGVLIEVVLTKPSLPDWLPNLDESNNVVAIGEFNFAHLETPYETIIPLSSYDLALLRLDAKLHTLSIEKEQLMNKLTELMSIKEPEQKVKTLITDSRQAYNRVIDEKLLLSAQREALANSASSKLIWLNQSAEELSGLIKSKLCTQPEILKRLNANEFVNLLFVSATETKLRKLYTFPLSELRNCS